MEEAAIRHLQIALLGLLALAAMLAGPAPLAHAATFTVDSTGDAVDANPGNGTCATAGAVCTLRAAIEEANHANNPGLDTINFNIAGGGPHTIIPGSALPTITDPVIIDGTSEPDFAGTPVIELDGSDAGGATGLTITAGDTSVRGLVINRFGLFGVHLLTAGNNTIVGNHIGTNVAGTADLGNNSVGVAVSSADNTIGGSAPADRNIISGNNASGVELNGAGVTGNVLQGNYIGTDVTGAVDLGNNLHGVLLNSGVSNNTVGGAVTGERNVISGNGVSGVSILKAAVEDAVSANSVTNNTVQGNYIGTDAAGSADLGNDGDGMFITSAGNTIGGTAAGAGNVISGNGGNGVFISAVDASVNVLEGNYVGTDSTGGTALGNSQSGVRINNAPSNTIGGTASGARNVISANGLDGVEIIGALATGNQVLGNYIGTDAGGTVDLGNADDGVELDAAPSNTVGGAGAGSPNLISGNNSDGVLIFQVGATGNQVLGNYIGTDASGTIDLGNGSDGVRIEEAPSNTVGGTTAAERNLISGNGVDGVEIVGGGAINNTILGNYIGTDTAGTTAVGNGRHGVLLSAPNSTVGGTTAGARNVISGNAESGILIPSSSSSNTIEGNYIGTDATGSSALGNGDDGISISDSPSNSIGATAPGAGNVISGNGVQGVDISGGSATGNVLLGNYIGTDATGTADLGNSLSGVQIAAAPTNTIGGPISGARNVISGNDSRGIGISGGAASGNVVRGNYIGTDVTGTADIGNSASGVLISGGANANTIGGTTGGTGNLISGNGGTGVLINNSPSNLVQGNFIGTDVTGTVDLGNSNDGVFINGANNNTIGGTAAGARNVISGNAGDGVSIQPSTASGNDVLGNYIGTDITGTVALGNTANGVLINASPNNAIGGTAAGARNVISANEMNGVEIGGTSIPNNANGNVVQGNLIGTDATGTADLGNSLDGVFTNGDNNSIGGSAAGARNVISGNGQHGIEITGDIFSNDNGVRGNYIGTDITGTVALGNDGDGIYVDVPFNFIGGTAGTTAGGPCTGACNVISGNGGHGVEFAGANADGNDIQGSYIGTDVNGTAGLGNGLNGVSITSGATANDVGGGSAGTGNLISSNNGINLLIFSGSSSNVVRGNHIGTDVNGAVALGSSGEGISISNSASNTIGGTTLSERNVISGNFLDGVLISGAGANSNVVRGNLIGTDSTGVAPVGSSFFGVRIQLGAFNNTIGVPGTLLNIIAYHVSDGVRVDGSATDDNRVRGNSIHSNGLKGIENINGGNDNLTPPTITGVIAGSLIGTACLGCIVDIYSDGEDEGWLPHGSTTADPIAGLWTFGGAIVGPNITATATASGNTSEFSSPFSFASTIIVDSTGDTNTADPVLTLREAVLLAKGGTSGDGVFSGLGRALTAGEGDNVSGSPSFESADTINFDTGVFPPGTPATISLVAALPKIDANYVTIDGTNGGSPAGVIVDGSGFLCFNIEDSRGNEIKGLQITGCSDGVRLTGGAELTTIGGTGAGEGNVISGNSANGVVIGAESAANHIVGNYIGTTADGNAADANASHGVRIETGAHHNHVGGTASGAGNVMSANGDDGVSIFGGGPANLVAGNFIGTDATGTVDLGNGFNGVTITESANNSIGGTEPGAKNLISGNVIGIRISGAGANGNQVLGNYIGTDVTGTLDLGNDSHGVFVQVPSNTIGGTSAGAGNLISGNDSNGVHIHGAATETIVQGNFIGTDATGTLDLGNAGAGVRIDDRPDNTIGGTAAGARNLISGNDSQGVWISGAGGTGNVVQGNYIGTDVTGTADLGNTLDGVFIDGSASNIVGGTVAGAKNLVSGNDGAGVHISGGASTSNLVQGNYIGVDAAGTADLGNSLDGVFINSAPANTIGGTTGGARNVISGNDDHGVRIAFAGADSNLVLGNYIGADVTGTADVGNSLAGVRISNAPFNDVGGGTAGAGNLISGNETDGIQISGTLSTESLVQGNLVGTDVTGAVALGNAGDGLSVVDAPETLVGVTVLFGQPDALNVFSGNGGDGISISGAPSVGTLVEGNYIGTDVTGAVALGNGAVGLRIFGAPDNFVGRPVAGTGNVISGNTQDGVLIAGSGATGNDLWNNYIGTDKSDHVDIGNGGRGVWILSDAANNVIGTTTDGNTIAFNGVHGVQVDGAATTGNTIRGNSIHDNDAKGIENIAGGNTELAPPVITAAGSASGTACANCDVDVYSDNVDEGRVYHGSAIADGVGNWSFPGAVIGPNVTATATDASGNTSEFSAPFSGCTDTDGDSLCDSGDPCPANPDCDGDSLGIGDPFGLFLRDGVEVFIGTLVTVACAATPAVNDEDPDALGPDWDDSQVVDGSDLFLYAERFPTESGVPPPIGRKPYIQRFDIYPTAASFNKIDGSDLFVLATYLGDSCP